MKKINAGMMAMVGSLTLAVNALAGNPIAKGDVVGNGGAYLGKCWGTSSTCLGVGYSGHVGLYDGNKFILEVTTDGGGLKNGSKVTCVHNNKTLQQFQSSVGQPTSYKVVPTLTTVNSWYWGAKYDKSLTSSTLAKIYDDLQGQYLFNATYSYMWGLVPAALPPLKFRCQAYNSCSTYCWDAYGNKKQISGDSVLRCDFAVMAAYLDVAGSRSSGWFNAPNSIPAPWSYFNAFPNTR